MTEICAYDEVNFYSIFGGFILYVIVVQIFRKLVSYSVKFG